MANLIYTLMNKDVPLCDFEIVGEGELEVCNMLKQHNPMPEWTEQISGWVGARSAAKHRVHINKILDLCGGKTKSGFIALTHCLSLTDTLWVKSEAELVLECDERFSEKRLATMNMIKNVQCDRILGIDAKWKWV